MKIQVFLSNPDCLQIHQTFNNYFFYFLVLQYNYVILPHLFLYLKPFTHHSLLFLKSNVSFILNAVTYMQMCIHTYSEIHSYKHLSLYNVTSVYDFRADNLLIEIQLVISSLRKTISPALSIL